MSSFLFGTGRQGFLDGELDWDADDVICLLIDTDALASSDASTCLNYTQISTAVSTHTGWSISITGKSSALGVADGDDCTFPSVEGPACEALIIYSDTHADDLLIAWVDGFTVTPNTGDITVQWDATANKIFKL